MTPSHFILKMVDIKRLARSKERERENLFNKLGFQMGMKF